MTGLHEWKMTADAQARFRHHVVIVDRPVFHAPEGQDKERSPAHRAGSGCRKSRVERAGELALGWAKRAGTGGGRKTGRLLAASAHAGRRCHRLATAGSRCRRCRASHAGDAGQSRPRPCLAACGPRRWPGGQTDRPLTGRVAADGFGPTKRSRKCRGAGRRCADLHRRASRGEPCAGRTAARSVSRSAERIGGRHQPGRQVRRRGHDGLPARPQFLAAFRRRPDPVGAAYRPLGAAANRRAAGGQDLCPWLGLFAIHRPFADRLGVSRRKDRRDAAGRCLLGYGLAALWQRRLADRLAGQPGRRSDGPGRRLAVHDLLARRSPAICGRRPVAILSAVVSAAVPHGVQRRRARCGLRILVAGRRHARRKDALANAVAPRARCGPRCVDVGRIMGRGGRRTSSAGCPAAGSRGRFSGPGSRVQYPAAGAGPVSRWTVGGFERRWLDHGRGRVRRLGAGEGRARNRQLEPRPSGLLLSAPARPVENVWRSRRDFGRGRFSGRWTVRIVRRLPGKNRLVRTASLVCPGSGRPILVAGRPGRRYGFRL